MPRKKSKYKWKKELTKAKNIGYSSPAVMYAKSHQCCISTNARLAAHNHGRPTDSLFNASMRWDEGRSCRATQQHWRARTHMYAWMATQISDRRRVVAATHIYGYVYVLVFTSNCLDVAANAFWLLTARQATEQPNSEIARQAGTLH